MSTWYIYFLKPVGCAGPIKVGFTSNTAKRLAAYQGWCPWKLELVTSLPVVLDRERWQRQAVQKIERRFHERYLPWFLHHEWFELNPLLEADIAAINGGTFDLASLPELTDASWRFQSKRYAELAA